MTTCVTKPGRRVSSSPTVRTPAPCGQATPERGRSARPETSADGPLDSDYRHIAFSSLPVGVRLGPPGERPPFELVLSIEGRVVWFVVRVGAPATTYMLE